MSWTRVYHLALRILPAELRCKHGSAIEALFAHELRRAQERGRLSGLLAGATGVWDVVRRGAYERVAMSGWHSLGEQRDDQPQGTWSTDAAGHDIPGFNLGGPTMPGHTTRQLLLRLAVAFTIVFVALTASMLALYARRQLLPLSDRGATTSTILEGLALAVPFTAALTIPMSVFVAVLSVFVQLGAMGALEAARRERGALRRLVTPVLRAAVGVGALTLVLTAVIVPRANTRLVDVLATGAAERTDRTSERSDRTMMIGELRAAARDARRDAGPNALARAASYEVEVQKKYALAAACVIFALAGAMIPLRFPHGGTGLLIGVSLAGFAMYYFCLTTGETLAGQLVVSPFVGMWAANAVLLVIALLSAWPSRRRLAPPEIGPLVASG